MWLPSGESLTEVEAFVTGFQHGRQTQGNPRWLDSFAHWVASRYRIKAGPRSGFLLIRAHVGSDERSAFAEFRRLLPEYIRDMQEIGPNGISARYTEVLAQIGEAP